MGLAFVELVVGRPLRLAEQAIDVLGLDAALERAKDDLEQAIASEMLRSTAAWVAGFSISPALTVTPEMLAILEGLTELGRREAALELERLGYTGIREPGATRALAAEEHVPNRDVEGYLKRNLRGVSVRIESELVVADLSDASQMAVANALLRVPGARDIASRVISTALIDGLGQTWEENQDLVLCWEYTAILDGGTCPACRPLDGKRYSSLEELFRDLPQFGPNPRCRGGGRCRCRAVPCDTAEAGQGGEPEPLVTPEPDQSLPAWLRELEATRADPALRGLDDVLARTDELVAQGASGARRAEAIIDAGYAEGSAIVSGGLKPAARMTQAEAAVIRAGETLDAELEQRIAPRVAVADAELATAEVELAAARARAASLGEDYRAALKRANLAESALQDRLLDELQAAATGPGGLTRPAWEIMRDAREHDEVIALKARHAEELLPLMREKSAAMDVVSAARDRAKTAQAYRQLLIRDTLLDVLEDAGVVMGPEAGAPAWAYTTGGVRGQAKQILEEASRYFPRRWIERGRTNPLKPTWRRDGRGYHRGGSSSSDIVISGGSRSKITTDPDGFATAIHELGHHLEHTDRRLRLLEWGFYQRRTRAPGYGDQEREFRFPRGSGYGSTESYRQDGFLESYMGKTYGNAPLSSYELLTMGLESLWTGSYDLDPEMRRFLLGLLATI